jgi:hypothetical protein
MYIWMFFMKDESLFGSPNKTRQRQSAGNDFPLTNSPHTSPFSSGKELHKTTISL